MFLKELDMNFLDEAVELAIENYKLEQEKVNALYNIDYKDELYILLRELFNKKFGSMIFNNNRELIGYLAFSGMYDTHIENIKRSYSPIYGYSIKTGNSRDKTISLLFQHVSEKLVKNNVGFFEIKVYAHDADVITSYVLNQFGILCTDTIKNIETPICETFKGSYNYVELTKQDIIANKTVLLQLWSRLRNHLRKSPTYYPGVEFTDDVYWNYINDSSTRLFVARDGVEIIGILDASRDGNCFANIDDKTMNVGDLYILESYRGQNVAQELLQFANGIFINEGYKRLWVEHGTTNPNAIRFWDKYFSRFTYTLTRTIDERIILNNK